MNLVYAVILLDQSWNGFDTSILHALHIQFLILSTVRSVQVLYRGILNA